MTTSADTTGAAVTPAGTSPTTLGTMPVDQLEEALKALARGAPTDLVGLLHDVESHAVVGGTKVTAHCHCLKLDAHGRPKVDHLVRAIAEQVIDYAIPRSQISEAHAEFVKNKSTQKFARLNNDAKKLFTSLK
jgi:hypothetical protein